MKTPNSISPVNKQRTFLGPERFITRYLISAGVFCELQKAYELQQAGKGSITVEQLLTASRHYRALIHVCVMELQRERTGA